MATWIERARATGYVFGQRLVGATKARDMCLAALDVQPGERVLDVGCGPAYYVEGLPDCEYFGFDTNSAQIHSARERFSQRRARFFDEPYTAERMRELAPFDKIFLLGILHHLNDATSRNLLDLAARSLKPQGRVVALDTPLYAGQSTLGRVLAKNDRGDFVRYTDAYVELAKPSFEKIDTSVFGDTVTIPWSFFMMVMSGPRTPSA